jgi:hypothetical protein
MMESIEIKSKRNIRRKQYQKHLQWKKKMTPTLGLSFGSFFPKRSLLQSDLDLKNNFKYLKIDFRLTLFVPAGNWVKFLKMAGC